MDGIVVAAKILLFMDPLCAWGPDSYKKIGLREGALVNISGATRRYQASRKRCGAMRHSKGLQRGRRIATPRPAHLTYRMVSGMLEIASGL